MKNRLSRGIALVLAAGMAVLTGLVFAPTSSAQDPYDQTTGSTQPEATYQPSYQPPPAVSGQLASGVYDLQVVLPGRIAVQGTARVWNDGEGVRVICYVMFRQRDYFNGGLYQVMEVDTFDGFQEGPELQASLSNSYASYGGGNTRMNGSMLVLGLRVAADGMGAEGYITSDQGATSRVVLQVMQ